MNHGINTASDSIHFLYQQQQQDHHHINMVPPVSYWSQVGVLAFSYVPDISHLLDPVYIVRDVDYVVIQCNEIAARILGYEDCSALCGHPLRNFISPGYRLQHEYNMIHVFNQMEPVTVSAGFRGPKGLRRDGSEFEVSVQLYPAIIQVPGFSHYEKIVACVVRDMTEHNQYVVRRNEAEKRNEATEKFLRLLNHEIRTSLHGIINTLALLKTDLHTYIDQDQRERALTLLLLNLLYFL